jgi:flagellar FliL protein
MKKSRNAVSILIVIIVLLILIIISASVGVYFYLYKSESVKVEQKVGKIKTPDIQQLERKKDVQNIDKIGPLDALDPFTVNLRSEHGEAYLKVQLSLELSIKELKNELDTKNAVIRDAIIRILTSKTLEELSTDEGKEATTDEIINDINAMLSDGYIKNIYFTKFIEQ